MTRTSKLNTITIWCSLNAHTRSPWFKRYSRGYEQACEDILTLIQADVAVLPLEEYRAIEGLINEL